MFAYQTGITCQIKETGEVQRSGNEEVPDIGVLAFNHNDEIGFNTAVHKNRHRRIH